MIFKNVDAEALANIYFEGKVTSHSLITQEGEKITVGIIYPGVYHFNTESSERMEITSGACNVKLDGDSEETIYESGQYFEVPASSGFEIIVQDQICQYVCRFLD